MRRHAIALMLCFVRTEAAPQEPTSRPAANQRRYFVAPVFKYTALRDQSAVMLGVRGGKQVSQSLVFGGGLYGTLSQVDAATGVVSAAGPLDVKFETFGVELEYVTRPGAKTHLALGAFLGGAANRYVKDATNEQDGETDFMLLLEPAVGAERNVTQWARLQLAISYRLVRGVEQRGLTQADFNGLAAAAAVKFGRFSSAYRASGRLS